MRIQTVVLMWALGSLLVTSCGPSAPTSQQHSGDRDPGDVSPGDQDGDHGVGGGDEDLEAGDTATPGDSAPMTGDDDSQVEWEALYDDDVPRNLKVPTETAPVPDALVPLTAEPGFPPEISNLTNLRGRLMYNDLRGNGRFADRFDLSEQPGSKHTGGPVEDGNLLGALDVVVDIFERDTNLEGEGCETWQHLGSASIAPDGRFGVALDTTDPCSTEGTAELVISFRLKSCHAWHCFATVDDDTDVYQLVHPLASPTNPLAIAAPYLDVGLLKFARDGGVTPGYEDDYEQAATVFAGAVDVIRWTHQEQGVDSRSGEFNFLKVRFPSTGAPNARAVGTSLIHITKPAAQFTNAGLAHEYGHTLNFRVWNGSGGGCTGCDGGQYGRNGNASWSATSLEYPYAAFKEGFANFVSRASKETCTPSFDDNAETPVTGKDDDGSSATPPKNGDGVPRNVTKFLCDWLDDTPEETGDAMHANFSQITDSMAHLWDNIESRANLDICSVAEWYAIYGNPETADDDNDEARATAVQTTLEHNGLECDLP